jgi:hypothetical protein
VCLVIVLNGYHLSFSVDLWLWKHDRTVLYYVRLIYSIIYGENSNRDVIAIVEANVLFDGGFSKCTKLSSSSKIYVSLSLHEL